MTSRPEERRKNSRNTLRQNSELVLSGKKVHKGSRKNISFSGVYMYCPDPKNITVGEKGIFIKPDNESEAISFMCQVIRTEDEGVGLKFININLEGYQKFKTMMLYNSADPDRLLDELDENPGLEIRKG